MYVRLNKNKLVLTGVHQSARNCMLSNNHTLGKMQCLLPLGKIQCYLFTLVMSSVVYCCRLSTLLAI